MSIKRANSRYGIEADAPMRHLTVRASAQRSRSTPVPSRGLEHLVIGYRTMHLSVVSQLLRFDYKLKTYSTRSAAIAMHSCPSIVKETGLAMMEPPVWKSHSGFPLCASSA